MLLQKSILNLHVHVKNGINVHVISFFKVLLFLKAWYAEIVLFTLQIEELTDVYCFIYQNVGLQWAD